MKPTRQYIAPNLQVLGSLRDMTLVLDNTLSDGVGGIAASVGG